MLRYYYVKQFDRLYVYDYDNGFYGLFDSVKKEWVTPVVSFSQTEHDFDIDFVEIPEEKAKEISHGVSFEKEYKEFVELLERVKEWAEKDDNKDEKKHSRGKRKQ